MGRRTARWDAADSARIDSADSEEEESLFKFFFGAWSEQYAAALMLGSQAASWVGLGVAGLPAVVPVTVFYWLWAVKNRLVGPLWSDLGVVTFGLVLASAVSRFPGLGRFSQG